ncbi:unnamed protein product, partial [Prorocentrum cordatum]
MRVDADGYGGDGWLKSPDKIISAQSWACRNGYQVSLGKALSTGDGPLQSSGGVGILVAGEIASRPLDLPGLGRFDGRIVGRVINAGFDQGLEIYSVYLVNDIGVTGENLELLEVLGALLLCSKRPWVVQGDWNFTPAALQLSGAPLFPHCPALLRLGNLCQTAVVQQQTRFKPFSTALMGPLPQERDIQWSDPLNSDLNTLAREWFGEAEARLVEIHGISDQKGYVGRSAGPQSRKVPLVALLERDHRRRFSKQTVCWISFEALLKKAKAISAGNPGTKGRALLGSWKLKLFDILEDLQLTEDGPTKAQLHTIVRAASGEGSWNDDVNGAICKECTRRQRLDAASQLAKCHIARSNPNEVKLLVADRTDVLHARHDGQVHIRELGRAGGLSLAATTAENTDNFLEARCYKVLISDPKDATIPDIASLRTAVALDALDHIAEAEQLRVDEETCCGAWPTRGPSWRPCSPPARAVVRARAAGARRASSAPRSGISSSPRWAGRRAPRCGSCPSPAAAAGGPLRRRQSSLGALRGQHPHGYGSRLHQLRSRGHVPRRAAVAG